jgi:protein-tyrosine phosphatase
VLPWLYVGDCGSGSDKTVLEEIGVRCVVNLHSHEDVELDGVKQFQFRLIDGEGNSWLTVLKILDVIDAERKVGNVLVHCCGGISRSPFIIVSYLAVKDGVDIDYALNTVSQKHPYSSIHPALIDLLLANHNGRCG